jgi:protein PhnA
MIVRMSRKKPKQRARAGELGKELTRRSRGRCELCAGSGDVRPYELPPFPDEPDPDRTLMACGRCRGWLETGEIVHREARFLSEAVWSDVPPVRLAAARLLMATDGLDDPWLQDAIDAANIDPATGEYRAEDVPLE